jgi:DNA-binding response OmpR family regulator
MKILLVEHNKDYALFITEAFKAYNHQIETATDSQTALELAKAFEYDLLLVDVIAPKLDGVELCYQLRTQGYELPIIILAEESAKNLSIKGIEVGADDYIIKPFEIQELIAKITALMRREKTLRRAVLRWENLELDNNTREVSYNKKRLHLTPKEYGLLELFLRNPSKTFTRSDLLNRLWLSSEFPGEEAVTTHVKGLRQKLKAAGMTKDLVETVYGLGYRLSEEKQGKFRLKEGDKKRFALTASQPRDSQATLQAETEVMALVTAKWQEFQPGLQEKLELFEQVLANLLTGSPDTLLVKQAQAQAHRLAGCLGCYGFPEASKTARAIEIWLQAWGVWRQSEALSFKRLERLIQSLQKTLQQQSSTPMTPSAYKQPSPRLLIIDEDSVLTKQIKLNAVTWGLWVELASNLKTAKIIIADNPPNVILLDLSFVKSQEDGLTFLRQLAQEKPKIPIIVYSAENQLHTRVEAARLGAYSFLHKNTTASEVLSVVKASLNHPWVTKSKVMIVDDDPLVLNYLKKLLLSQGIQVTTLQEPERFWQMLEAVHPDLLILDIEMPNFSGIELCQALRTDIHWNDLPVLFISVHSNTEIVYKLYAVGADDFVQKPIIEQELIIRILNRLQRTQLSREQNSSSFHLKVDT